MRYSFKLALGCVSGLGRDMDLTLIIAPILALVSCAVVFWLILNFSSEKITKQYRALAARFGLELEQLPPKMRGFIRPDPTVYGTYREREISFSAPGRGM